MRIVGFILLLLAPFGALAEDAKAPRLPPVPPPGAGASLPGLPPVPGAKPAAPTAGKAEEKAGVALPPPPPTSLPPVPGQAPAAKAEPAAKPAVAAKAPPTGAGSKQPPLKGSHVAADQNACLMCHGDPDLWDQKNRRLFVAKDLLADDVHFRAGVSCHDCHGGNYQDPDLKMAHAREDGFRQPLGEIRKACVYCHKEENVRLLESLHGKAGDRDDQGRGAPLACDKCHGKVSHGLLAHVDPRSPLFPDNQVVMCDKCHKEKHEAYKNDLATYTSGVHGQGLFKLGLQVTAVCADCHGSHGIYYAVNEKSTLHPTRVAKTCGKCHRFIEERLEKSVHGRGNGPGSMATHKASGGNGKRRPSCTDCHQGHDQVNPESVAFRLQLPYRCGNCHSNLSGTYAMSIHGELSELGYGPGAKCSDCHGAHDILPVAEPQSRLSAANRAQTCGQCHVTAAGSFLSFDPHVDHTDAKRNPLVHAVYVFFLTLLMSVFGFFGIHTVLWFVRSLVDVFRHGRPRALAPGQTAYVRFVPFHRWGHAFLLTSFLGLALTGLPLKYSHSAWAKNLAYTLGGFQSTSVWHRVFAIITFACFLTYVFYLARHMVRRRHNESLVHAVFGPDSPMPNFRDVKDFFRMLLWFVGLGRKPTFERWAYWEKFDFWGACGDVLIIGFTGLILWFPNLFCSFLPAVTLNIAKVIHSTQALLATGFVFAIHFFNTHLRADKFPVDMSALTGLVSEEEFQHERPEYMERLRREGGLDERRTVVPSRRRLWTLKILGFLALAVGLFLLAGMILAGLEH